MVQNSGCRGSPLRGVSLLTSALNIALDSSSTLGRGVGNISVRRSAGVLPMPVDVPPPRLLAFLSRSKRARLNHTSLSKPLLRTVLRLFDTLTTQGERSFPKSMFCTDRISRQRPSLAVRLTSPYPFSAALSEATSSADSARIWLKVSSSMSISRSTAIPLRLMPASASIGDSIGAS